MDRVTVWKRGPCANGTKSASPADFSLRHPKAHGLTLTFTVSSVMFLSTLAAAYWFRRWRKTWEKAKAQSYYRGSFQVNFFFLISRSRFAIIFDVNRASSLQTWEEAKKKISMQRFFWGVLSGKRAGKQSVNGDGRPGSALTFFGPLPPTPEDSSSQRLLCSTSHQQAI